MRRNLIIFAMLIAMTFVGLAANNAVSAQNKHGRGHKNGDMVWQPGKHHGKWHKKNAHGYRNYGQYRRTQVGHRRYRMVKRYYWSDGTRLSRLTRVYY